MTAIEEMAVEIPEEVASGRPALFLLPTLSSNSQMPGSDALSAEEWEDNSMMASDSEMGMVGTP